MNKFFVFALFALVAVCAAAPSEEVPADVLNPVESVEAKNLEGHDQDKRAIYYGYPGYRYLPNYYRTYPSYPLTYPSLSYPYYGRLFI